MKQSRYRISVGRLDLSSLPFVCSIRVTDADAGRLDACVGRLQVLNSRARAQKLIDAGAVLLNKKAAKASSRVKAGDLIWVRVPKPRPLRVEPEDIELDILYEDSHLIVVNKARGMVVHPGAGNFNGTLVNALMYRCKDLSGIGGVLRPGIVHRIDKDTSGVLVVAKNDNAHISLAAQLKEHSMKRVYKAIVVGTPRGESGRVSTMIGRHPVHRQKMAVVQKGGKAAVTNWKLCEHLRGHSLVEARLETGRTHQIRVHMAYLGHPLFGDSLYGGPDGGRWIRGQALHAEVLGFTHPATGEYYEFRSELPGDMQVLLEHLRTI